MIIIALFCSLRPVQLDIQLVLVTIFLKKILEIASNEKLF
jgi:hypothetical protein